MNFTELISKTNKIIAKGWLKSLYNGTGGLGVTFEKHLGIQTNTFEIPDYDGIEIKTKQYNKGGYISLFNATPDSFLFEIKRIQATYGYPDSKNKNYKVFNMSFYSNQKIYIGKGLYGMLNIDRKKRKIFLFIINKNNKIIDSDCSWSFDLLNEKINRKLQNLFLVYGDKFFSNNITYYKYLTYHCYKLKNFDAFLQCLEKGYVRISFKIGVIRGGNKDGHSKDHGTSFDILETKIKNLYSEVK